MAVIQLLVNKSIDFLTGDRLRLKKEDRSFVQIHETKTDLKQKSTLKKILVTLKHVQDQRCKKNNNTRPLNNSIRI